LQAPGEFAVMASSDQQGSSGGAPKPVPGSYGLPVIGAVRDRLDFYYFQGQDKYFESRIERYSSTVVRLNVPPGPFMAKDPRVVAVLDAKSFPVLFDMDKVEKKNLFTGTYMPSTDLTGGYRVCSYLDPSEPTHTKVKQMLFNLLLSRKDEVIPTFRSNFSSLLATVESELAKSGKAEFNKLNDVTSFDFIGEAYFGVRPSSTDLGSGGPTKAAKWLIWQLHPLVTLGLPMILEEPLLHTFHLPPFLVKGDYKALYRYYSAAGKQALDVAEGLGLSREEACHNLLFATTFNSYGGLKVFFPGLVANVAGAGEKLHERHVKKDLEIESHDGVFQVRKGEMLFGYQPCATRDARVFGATAGQFVPDRFVGDEGSKLLQYVYWSNGRETESPSVGNKQCPGKNLVVLVGRLLVVELFLRYDTFTATVDTELLGTSVFFTGVTKATSGPGASSSE